MKSILRHVAALREAIERYDERYVWLPTVEWLVIASGIEHVRFNSIRFNEAFGYCSSADEFEMSRDKLRQKYVTGLTRFMFCWGALESTIRIINPPKLPEHGPDRDGTVNRACNYLSQHAQTEHGFRGYNECLIKVRSLIENHLGKQNKLLKRFSAPKIVSPSGLGMYVIYGLRNQLVHGAADFSFPTPDGENKPNNALVQLPPAATRTVLFSIQHLMTAFVQESQVQSMDEERADIDQAFLRRLRTLHLSSSKDRGQERLLW